MVLRVAFMGVTNEDELARPDLCDLGVFGLITFIGSTGVFGLCTFIGVLGVFGEFNPGGLPTKARPRRRAGVGERTRVVACETGVEGEGDDDMAQLPK